MSDAVLREKAMLLLKRERELLSLRQRLAWTAGWLAVSEDTAATLRQPGARLEHQWPSILVERLKFQQAMLAERDGNHLVVLGVGGAASCSIGARFPCPGGDACADAGFSNGVEPGSPLLPGLRRFMWCPINWGSARWVAITGFDERVFQFHPELQAEDLAYFRVACRQLEALMSQVESIRSLRELNEALRQNDAALRATREQLLSSTRLAAVGEMAGRTAHEVLNPLTGIQGRVDLMLGLDTRLDQALETLKAVTSAWRAATSRGGVGELMRELARLTEAGVPMLDDDLSALEAIGGEFDRVKGQQRASLAVVRREVDRIAHIVDGLRGLSRTGRTVERLPLRTLLAESVDVVSPALTRRGIELTIVAEADLTLLVDRYEFIQVVTNLLRNAIHAIETRGPSGRITLEAVQESEVVRLFVRDDGVGIDPQHVPLLFEHQFTTRVAGEGTGLGLSIARRLARAARGDLRLADSTPGLGTTFVLEFPLAVSDAHGHAAHR